MQSLHHGFKRVMCISPRLLGALIAVFLVLSSTSPSRAQSWSLIAPAGPLPVPRDISAAVYSSASNRLILFGGYPHVTPYTNDLWILSDANGLGTPTWTQVIPNGAPGSPQARAGAVMVYDAQNNRAILAGGESAFPALANLNDVWVLINADGTTGNPTWTQLNPQGGFPGREDAGAVYDAQSNRLIVFMGVHPGGLCRPTPCIVDPADVWVLTNANGLGGTPVWNQLSASGAPPGRSYGSVDQTYDPVNNRVMVFGGLRPAQPQVLNDVWVLTNANGLGNTPPTWTQLSPSGSLPAARSGNTAFYDVQTNRLVIFGGSNEGVGGPLTNFSDIWALDNANGLGGAPAWQQLNPTGLAITPHVGSSGLYDSARNRMILFGGNVNGFVANETWVLSDANGIRVSQLKIDAVQPNHGGQGTVTAQVVGGGFQSGATVKLTGLGSDIVGTNTTVPNLSIITTTFNLTGATPGARTVVITNPDNTSVILPVGFTVEQGGVPEISVQIIGRDRIRFATEQTYYLEVVNTGSIDSPPGLALLEIPSTLGFQQPNGASLFVAGNSSAPEFGIPTLGSPASTGATNVPAATASLASNQVLVFASSGVPAGANQTAPVSLTLPFSVPSQFTVGAAWQPGLTNLTFDQYRAAVGVPYIPFQPACSQCYAQAVDQVMSITDAETAYTTWQISTQDLALKQKLSVVAIGSVLVQAKVVKGLALSGPEGLALAAVIVSATYFANHFLDPTSNPDANLIDLNNNILAADRDFLADPAAKAIPAIGSLLTLFDAEIAAAKGLGSITDARNAESTAWLSFQTSLNKYLSARNAYQSCLSQSCQNPPPPPPPPPLPGTATLPVTGVSSLDPNDKEGPAGSQPQRYVSGSTALVYLISFENQASATAPAQRVVITDLVDPANFDLSTAALGPITFSSQVVDPSALPLMAIGAFSTFADLRPSVNLLVHVTASLNSTTGVLTWTLQSIDPSTGQPPTDPLAGFLPPGNGGSVSLNIRGKNSLVTGAAVSNGATIIFDSNPSIPTPVWSNTIDNSRPVSRVSALPTQSYPSFLVQWAGSDVGSGIQDFTIYVSDDGASFVPWRTNIALTDAMFLGLPSHTYAFYGIARDLVGNVENAKTAAEASTRIIADTTPPVVTPYVSGTLGINGWYRSNVSVFWSVADLESGVSSSNGCLGTTLTADTAGVTTTCSATNGVGLSTSVPVTIKIDKTPPVITGSGNPATLWPPNGKMVPVTISGTMADNLSGINPSTATFAVQDSYGIGQPSGHVSLAPNGTYSFTISLEARRDGQDQNGRLYTIVVSAQDNVGNAGSATTIVIVPHDQGN